MQPDRYRSLPITLKSTACIDNGWRNSKDTDWSKADNELREFTIAVLRYQRRRTVLISFQAIANPNNQREDEEDKPQ